MQDRPHRGHHLPPRLDRRALVAVAVLIAFAAVAAHLSPAPLVPPAPSVPPLPGDGGVIGSLMLLLPLYGVLRFVGRFGRTPHGGR